MCLWSNATEPSRDGPASDHKGDFNASDIGTGARVGSRQRGAEKERRGGKDEDVVLEGGA